MAKGDTTGSDDKIGWLTKGLVASDGPSVSMICAEKGMGKTRLLQASMRAYAKRSLATRYEDMAGLCVQEALARLVEVQRWCERIKRTSEDADGARGLVAIDNLVVGDEADNERIVKALRRLTDRGLTLVVSTMPDGEVLAEQMGEATCYWSCDLCLPRPEDPSDARIFDEYIMGVPLLAEGLSRVSEVTGDALASDPSYQESFIAVIGSVVRENMMDEECQLRMAMLLLGHGTLKELQDVLGRIDLTVWRLLVRDAPVLGVDATHGTFCCVGAHSIDCLNAAYPSLSEMARPWPSLVAHIADELAKRGDVLRAAVVSLMCADDAERCAVVLRWGTLMLDAGEVSVVEDTLEACRENCLKLTKGYYETRCAVAALQGARKLGTECLAYVGNNTPEGQHARLSMWCRSLLAGEGMDRKVVVSEGSDSLVRSLATHGNALCMLARGRLKNAYDLLLNNVRLDDYTVSSSFIIADYLLCSLLMGIVPSLLDIEAMTKIETFYERSGLVQLNGIHDVMLHAGLTLAGRMPCMRDFDVEVHRAERRDEGLLRGLFLLVSGVGDMRVGATMRAYVRISQALEAFDAAGAKALTKEVRLVYCAVRAQLGERVLRSEIESCRGVSKALDDVVSILVSAITSKKLKKIGMTGGWSVTSKAREIHWLVNVLANDCGAVSTRFRSIMPAAWSDAQIRITAEVDDFCSEYLGLSGFKSATLLGPNGSDVGPSPISYAGETKPVEVNMLGSFEILVEGKVMPCGKLEKRRAKSMLALLAALPGHVAKRYTIMEEIWPTYDYASANKCVYSATSILRAEIGAAFKEPMDRPLVIANKAQGTVSLNSAVIGSDVELFESKARHLLDIVDMDREVIVLCREIEELYKGDLFVPPTDGLGVIEARSHELKALYVDAMTAGSVAAANRGMKTLACRFAHKAHEADGLREDALKALVSALSDAGRQVEARRCYERFVGRMVDMTRRPPSRELREEMEEMLAGLASEDVVTQGFKPKEQLRLNFGTQDTE